MSVADSYHQLHHIELPVIICIESHQEGFIALNVEKVCLNQYPTINKCNTNQNHTNINQTCKPLCKLPGSNITYDSQ